MSCNCQQAASILARCHGQSQPRAAKKTPLQENPGMFNNLVRNWMNTQAKPLPSSKGKKRVTPMMMSAPSTKGNMRQFEADKKKKSEKDLAREAAFDAWAMSMAKLDAATSPDDVVVVRGGRYNPAIANFKKKVGVKA